MRPEGLGRYKGRETQARLIQTSKNTMHWSTRVFLVLLRLVIGWHFLFAGREKLDTPNWTSEPYLRGAVGPAAGCYRGLIGDSVTDRLTPGDGLPPELRKDWQAYLDAFISHYQLDEEQKQLAQTKFDQRVSATASWLSQGGTERKVKKVLANGSTVEMEVRTESRLREYLDKRQQIWDIQDKELSVFSGGAPARLGILKGDADRLRTDLRADIDEQTAELKKALASVLTSEQQKMEPLPEPVQRRWSERNPLQWIDWLTRWGLTVIGACLLLGLLTRLACLGGAGFLLLVVAAIPPLLWLSPDIQMDGYKNILEMLALFALATTRSGRWFGVDGLIQFLNPFRWRRRAAAEAPVERTPTPHAQPRPQPTTRPTATATTPKPRSWRD